MVAFVANRQISPGQARLEVEMVFNESTVTSAFATNPMKLFAPRARGQSVWAYSSTFGGGLVAGDQTRLRVAIGQHARCFLGTQASTKIYRNPTGQPCGHKTEANLASGSLLVFAPDPVQAFASSRYSQRQEFHLAPDAGLVFVDWFSSGRVARGERWEFDCFQSRNDVFVSGERVFVDSLRLNLDNGSMLTQHRTGRFNCFATLLMLGLPVQDIAATLLQNISSLSVARGTSLVCSASPMRDGVLLRIAGESVELVGRELHHHLQPLSALLGDDPWSRKW